MDINIGLGYYIEVTRRNYILKQRYFGYKKDGTRVERNKVHGSHNSLRSACEAYIRINQIPIEAKISVDIIEYVKLVEKANKMAVQALNEAIEGKDIEV